MEFVERLASYLGDERWLVESNGHARVAWFVRGDGDNPDWLARTHALNVGWLGPIHPRIGAIYASTLLGADRLLLEIDDDRGPSFRDAAAQLADPDERERWSVAQIIALADGVTALQARGQLATEVHDERCFVDEGGHVRLRASLIHAPRPPSTRAGPGPGADAARYLAPEQSGVRGQATAASNVFGLATLLHEALAGVRPFQEESFLMELAKIMTREPAPLPTRTPALAGVVTRAFVKDPRQRIASPAAFADELRRAIPDAADYDAVISDRLVTWRAIARVRAKTFDDVTCQRRWDELPPTSDLVRHCGTCEQHVLRIRSNGAPIPIHGWSCRPR